MVVVHVGLHWMLCLSPLGYDCGSGRNNGSLRFESKRNGMYS